MSSKRCGISALALGFAVVFGVGLLMTTVDASAQDRDQARSMVISQYGIVAAESPLAAQAGVEILRKGGNAVDAAVAANAMMGLVAPMSNGVGGDLFAIVYDAKTGKLYGLNASGWAPAGLTLDSLRGKGLREMPLRGIQTVTVPGAVDGWQKLLERFGRKKLADVLAPAIRTADAGFPVPEWVAGIWAGQAGVLKADRGAAKTYLVEGRTPRLGEVFRNPDLAHTYREIAEHGRDAFYRGEIARRIVELSRREGGTMTPEDLAGYSAEWVEPLSTTYRGWTVYELPPNGQGVAALEMLNLMETFPLGEYGFNTAKTLHVMIEAKKLAYADLMKYIGDPRRDPDVMKAVAGMLSKAYARQRAGRIDRNKANCEVAPGEPLRTGGDTIYLSSVDQEGNMVSLIQSNYENFGSGLVPEGVGFALQDRGALFSLDPSSPNVVAGHKRPLHTIIPAFMEKGQVKIAFGIMGGWNQSQAHAQFVSHVVDFHQNIQLAMEAARFTKQTFSGCDVQVEGRIPPGVRAELSALGHVLRVHAAYTNRMGGGQAVMRDFAAGVNYGASDPRKDGEAIPQLPPEK